MPNSSIAGDPYNESRLLIALQDTVADLPGVLPAARGLSFVGEHAAGWLALAAVGMAVDAPRRSGWAKVGASAFVSHAASVVLKRVVRRQRPHHPGIRIGVATPSKLSFPSSHATSTTATAVSVALLLRSPLPLAVIPLMAASRLVVGVHYPTDVTAGAVLGAGTALVVEALPLERILPAAMRG